MVQTFEPKSNYKVIGKVTDIDLANIRGVLLDIDDTLYCSGGHWPAGVDKRYPRKVLYPGCTAFFKVLEHFKNFKEMPPRGLQKLQEVLKGF